MATALSCFKSRYHWTDRLAALSIVVGATLCSALCVANGDAGTGIGVLLVFAMALLAVLGGRSEARLASPTQRRGARETQATHGADFAQRSASASA